MTKAVVSTTTTRARATKPPIIIWCVMPTPFAVGDNNRYGVTRRFGRRLASDRGERCRLTVNQNNAELRYSEWMNSSDERQRSVPVGPPSHRRVRLGIALRQAREAMPSSVTQAMAAQATGLSQSKINRLEKALVVRVKMDELNRLMDYYGMDETLAVQCRTFARSPYSEVGTFVETSPNAVWWQQHQQVERFARVIKAVLLQAHDGLIQCPAYMRRQFELAGAMRIEAKMAARLARQRAVLDQRDPPECTFLLDEACLHTDMGDPGVMREQIAHLLTLTEHPHVTILIKPFDAHFYASTYGWTHLQFGTEMMRDFVSVEYGVGAATIDDDDALRLFQTRWEQFRGASLSEVESRERLRLALG